MTLIQNDFESNEIIELIHHNVNLKIINEILRKKTGIINFFSKREDIINFQKLLNVNFGNEENTGDLGDFQTPTSLTDKICNFLVNAGYNPTIILEPTVGKGNFIFSALKFFPKIEYIYAIDIQAYYEWVFKLNCFNFLKGHPNTVKIEFHRDNIFSHQFSQDFNKALEKENKDLLILGNPPWITNTQLSILDSTNLPQKSNIKKVSGIEAITGKSNFDIAESIILQLLNNFSHITGKLAMILKTSVIRNIIRDLPKFSLNLANMQEIQIDAKKEFDINASAALFIADFGERHEKNCIIKNLDTSTSVQKQFGYYENFFVSDIDSYKNLRYLEGKSPFTWRQGIKHDASSIMILKRVLGNLYINNQNEKIELEDNLIYPLVRGSQLQKDLVMQNTPNYIIIPQKKVGEKTNYIQKMYPKLWGYLLSHQTIFDRRKSSIYKNKPRFSIFGVGEYSFKPFKIGISGFYKKLNFCLILPINEKPVMLDDTSYFLSFNELYQAFFVWVILNKPEIREYLNSIAFLNDKRPFTKDILMRINFKRFLNKLTYEDIIDFYKNNLKNYFDFEPLPELFNQFKDIMVNLSKNQKYQTNLSSIFKSLNSI